MPSLSNCPAENFKLVSVWFSLSVEFYADDGALSKLIIGSLKKVKAQI